MKDTNVAETHETHERFRDIWRTNIVETHETHEHCRDIRKTNVAETHGKHKRYTVTRHKRNTFQAHISYTFGITGFDVVKQRAARCSCYRKVKPGVRQDSKDHFKGINTILDEEYSGKFEPSASYNSAVNLSYSLQQGYMCLAVPELTIKTGNIGITFTFAWCLYLFGHPIVDSISLDESAFMVILCCRQQ
jgi:hypothetical protein